MEHNNIPSIDLRVGKKRREGGRGIVEEALIPHV
jgi:hypothetical protein